MKYNIVLKHQDQQYTATTPLEDITGMVVDWCRLGVAMHVVLLSDSKGKEREVPMFINWSAVEMVYAINPVVDQVH